MMLTRPNSGESFGVTLAHVVPPFCVTWINPSSEPAQMTFALRFDGAIVKTTP